MVEKKQQTAEDPEVVIESALNRTEEFFRVNGKKLLILLGAIVVIVGGLFAYNNLHKIPQQERAASQGFLQIIGKYGSTPSGNLAHHYAGQCYLRLGRYDEAIAEFNKYKKVKGIPAQLINAMNEGLKGDAYVQKGEIDKGIRLYEDAVKTSNNDFTAPYYSLKAGILYMEQGNMKKALDMFYNIRYNYPSSNEAAEIEKYIGEVEQKI